ncbi:hypothetical protein ABZ747_29045 [Kitasatospora cineracea]|uniref:hypothetical protein n=1 Tax=Kitasatospora cineracea TaxID=88074 RepID=UPI0033D4495B
MSRENGGGSPLPDGAQGLGVILASGHTDEEVKYQLGRLLLSSNSPRLERKDPLDDDYVEHWAGVTDGWGAVKAAGQRLLAAGEARNAEYLMLRARLVAAGRPRREALNTPLSADRERDEARAALARALGHLADLYAAYLDGRD